MPTVERIVEGYTLAEGPHWDVSTQSLYFIDIIDKNISRYTPSTKKLTKGSVEKAPTFIIPIEGQNNKFIISLENQLSVISWNGESDDIKIVQNIGVVESTSAAPKLFNDAKCDSSGRLWAGAHTIDNDFAKTQPLGVLYSIDATKQLKSQVDKIRCSNGIAFNDKTKKMFYVDSLAGSVDRFDFDIITGTVSNRTPWFTLQKLNIPGIPDGMTIDSDGNLWVAIVGASRVLKVDGSKSETLLDTINIPTEQVTSLTFGGQNLDELYVTTGFIDFRGVNPSRPAAGAIYKVTGIGAKGLPAVNFKLSN